MMEASTNDRASLGFAEAVQSALEIVALDHGLGVVEAGPTRVRYESGLMFLNIYHGRQSYEAGVGAAISITSDPQFENFTIDVLGGVGIGFGSSLTASLGLGGSGDVGLAVIGTRSRNIKKFVPEPGVFGAARVGQVTVSGAAGVGVGEGTGVVFGISLPGVSVTREELRGFFR